MQLPLTLSRVKRKFREAEEVYGKNGLEFLCNHSSDAGGRHTKGGIKKLYINADSGAYYCQDCGESGSAVIWFDDTEDAFKAQVLIPTRDAEPTSRVVRHGGAMWADDVPMPGDIQPLSSLPDDHEAIKYLASRGFNVEELKSFNEPKDPKHPKYLDYTKALWYCSKGVNSFPPPNYLGTTSGRIIFPLYMTDGFKPQLKGWQARSIDYVLEENEQTGIKVVWNGRTWRTFHKINGEWEDREVPKYYFSHLFPRRGALYGFNTAKLHRRVAVVEGALDYHSVGDECVALLGGNGFATADQIRLLQAHWDELFWILDPGVDLKRADKLQKWNKMEADLYPAKVRAFYLSSGKDPGATPRNQIWRDVGTIIKDNRSFSHHTN